MYATGGLLCHKFGFLSSCVAGERAVPVEARRSAAGQSGLPAGNMFQDYSRVKAVAVLQDEMGSHVVKSGC